MTQIFVIYPANLVSLCKFVFSLQIGKESTAGFILNQNVDTWQRYNNRHTCAHVVYGLNDVSVFESPFSLFTLKRLQGLRFQMSPLG